MISSMLGAPLGGTTRGGQYGLESTALSLITPPNGIGGGGSCFPSSVTVALAEPGMPLICWAGTLLAASNQATVNAAPSDTSRRVCCFVLMLSHLLRLLVGQAALRLIRAELHTPSGGVSQLLSPGYPANPSITGLQISGVPLDCSSDAQASGSGRTANDRAVYCTAC